MAVAHDASSISAVSTSAASFSWTHTPTGTPRSVLVWVLTVSATRKDTSATYGGAAMTALPYTGVDSDTEPATVAGYFLDNVAAGAQTVLVNRTNDATQVMGIAVTQTAASACQTYDAGTVTQGGSSQNTAASTSGTGTGASGEVAIDDGSPGTNSERYAVMYTGAATPVGQGTNSTTDRSNDFTAFGWSAVHETTAGQGSRNVGFATGTTDDRAAIYLAVRETPPDSSGQMDPMGAAGIFGI